jgi:ribonuclease HI
MLNTDNDYIVFTDGSCWTGDRIGGYAFVIIDEEDNTHSGGGSDEDTTISRMELMGAISSLEFIHERCGPSVVLLYSDSQYVVLGAMDKTRARRLNVDLWHRLDSVMGQHRLVHLEHVRGHKGDHYNELADDLAGDFRKARQIT